MAGVGVQLLDFQNRQFGPGNPLPVTLAAGGNSVSNAILAGSGNFVVPAGVVTLRVLLLGGGGGGGGVSTAAATGTSGSPGGYGQYSLAVVPGQSIAYVVGAAGAGGAAGANGTAGGDTTFGSLVIKGGLGGNGSTGGNATTPTTVAALDALRVASSVLPPTAASFCLWQPTFGTASTGSAGVGGSASNIGWGVNGAGGNLGNGAGATGFAACGGGAGSNAAANFTGGNGAPGAIFFF